jgi:polar amino acid transport system permease protein
MSGYRFDWSAVLGGQPLSWLMHGVGVTVVLTALAAMLASALAVLLLSLRLAPFRPAGWLAGSWVQVFRNTPLAVQMLFWYFGGVLLLPESWRDTLSGSHALLGLPLPGTELLVAAWSLGLFGSAFLAEDLRAGLRAVPFGQWEAARSQGFATIGALRRVILPQALAHAWPPLVNQYLNLLKNSPLAMSIAVAELMYQTNQIESFNFHAIEAYAVASAIYLLLGLALSLLLGRLGPTPLHERKGRHGG